MFSEKLKSLRKEKGLTQEELASKTFISRSLIAKYETGVTYPTKENLEKLALFFNVDIDELIDNTETTCEFVNSKSIAEKINNICLIIVLIVSFFISIFIFIPIFEGIKYKYPVALGEIPELVHFTASLFTGTYNYGNFVSLILLFLSIITSVIALFSIIYRHKKYSPFLNLISYLFFGISFFLLTFTIIICFSYIS